MRNNPPRVGYCCRISGDLPSRSDVTYRCRSAKHGMVRTGHGESNLFQQPALRRKAIDAASRGAGRPIVALDIDSGAVRSPVLAGQRRDDHDDCSDARDRTSKSQALDRAGGEVGVVHRARIGRPRETVRHRVSVGLRVRCGQSGVTRYSAPRFSRCGRSSMLPTQKQPSGPTLPSLSRLVGGSSTGSVRLTISPVRGSNSTTRCRSATTKRPERHRPKLPTTSGKSHDVRAPVIHRQGVDALAGDVAKQQPAGRCIPHRGFGDAAAGIPDEFEFAHGCLSCQVRRMFQNTGLPGNTPVRFD